jgi:hypothetical protein
MWRLVVYHRKWKKIAEEAKTIKQGNATSTISMTNVSMRPDESVSNNRLFANPSNTTLTFKVDVNNEVEGRHEFFQKINRGEVLRMKDIVTNLGPESLVFTADVIPVKLIEVDVNDNNDPIDNQYIETDGYYVSSSSIFNWTKLKFHNLMTTFGIWGESTVISAFDLPENLPHETINVLSEDFEHRPDIQTKGPEKDSDGMWRIRKSDIDHDKPVVKVKIKSSSDKIISGSSKYRSNNVDQVFISAETATQDAFIDKLINDSDITNDIPEMRGLTYDDAKKTIDNYFQGQLSPSLMTEKELFHMKLWYKFFPQSVLEMYTVMVPDMSDDDFKLIKTFLKDGKFLDVSTHFGIIHNYADFSIRPREVYAKFVDKPKTVKKRVKLPAAKAVLSTQLAGKIVDEEFLRVNQEELDKMRDFYTHAPLVVDDGLTPEEAKYQDIWHRLRFDACYLPDDDDFHDMVQQMKRKHNDYNLDNVKNRVIRKLLEDEIAKPIVAPLSASSVNAPVFKPLINVNEMMIESPSVPDAPKAIKTLPIKFREREEITNNALIQDFVNFKIQANKDIIGVIKKQGKPRFVDIPKDIAKYRCTNTSKDCKIPTCIVHNRSCKESFCGNPKCLVHRKLYKQGQNKVAYLGKAEFPIKQGTKFILSVQNEFSEHLLWATAVNDYVIFNGHVDNSESMSNLYLCDFKGNREKMFINKLKKVAIKEGTNTEHYMYIYPIVGLKFNLEPLSFTKSSNPSNIGVFLKVNDFLDFKSDKCITFACPVDITQEKGQQHTIYHTAFTRYGDCGLPIITTEGQLMGIHFARMNAKDVGLAIFLNIQFNSEPRLSATKETALSKQNAVAQPNPLKFSPQ